MSEENSFEVDAPARFLRHEYMEKAASRTIGRMARRARSLSRVRFNPNAWDADNDGRVQDGTSMERPATPGVNDFASRAMQSTSPKIRQVVPQRSGEQMIYGQKRGRDGKEVRANRVDWLKGLSSKQISELIVPSNREQLYEMFRDMRMPHISGTVLDDGAKKVFEATLSAPHKDIDFSPSAVAEMREIVRKALDESPAFKWAAENFGMPAYVKRSDSGIKAFNELPEQKIYIDELNKIDPQPSRPHQGSVATTYGNIRTTFLNTGESPEYSFGEKGYVTPQSLAVIDDTMGGIIRHEWGHYLQALLAEDDELPSTSRMLKTVNSGAQKTVGDKYEMEKPLVQNLLSGKKDKSLPSARSAYAHTSMQEMFAEGIAAYLHPTDSVRHYAINDVLRSDIETALGVGKGKTPWLYSSASPTPSGRRDRRNAGSVGRMEMSRGLSSGARKPFKPRPPDNGPLTGQFLSIFKGVKSFEEFKQRYDELEIVFFDYETTGLGDDDKPIQLGAVKIKGGKVVDRFNFFMNPERELSDWSKENLKDQDGNPLTDEWLRGRPSVKEAHAQFVAWAGKNPLMGGQYTPFDLGFLERSLRDSGLEMNPAGVIDSKAMADDILPKWTPDEPTKGPFQVGADGKTFASNSLGPLADFFGIDMGGGWHTADVDSETSALIVSRMLEYAISNPDASKQLLDIDGIPKRQDEKHQRYARQMAEYEKALREISEENSVTSGSSEMTGPPVPEFVNLPKTEKIKRSGMSSGRISRNLPFGSVSKKKEKLSVDKLVPGKTWGTKHSISVHKVGDEQLVFGQINDEVDFSADNPDVKFLPINPYAISGYESTSEKGREFAELWTYARAGRFAENKDSSDTYVDALLYAASRGDEDAMKELQEYAERGKEEYEKSRKRFIERNQEYLKEINDNAFSLSEIEREGLSDFTLDDMVLVHETTYEPQYDADGNLIIRPIGDYELTDSDGNKIEYPRHTLHFAMNHLAAGHMMRRREENSFIIIVPLRSLLEANGGMDSLDALNVVDTYLTPKPGEPLRIPNPKVIKNDGSIDNVDDAVNEAITEMGSRVLDGGRDGQYTTRGQDARIAQIALENNIHSGLHANNPHGYLEDLHRAKRSQYIINAAEIAQLGRNAMLRLSDNDRWSAERISQIGGLDDDDDDE